jgi:hypothetical protein
MTEANSSPQDRQEPKPHSGLQALEVMVGTWDLKGRDFTTKEEIRGTSTFEWLEGRFFLVHKFNFDYAGRRFAGVEYIGYDEKSGHLKTHVFSSQNPAPLEYTWEVDEHTFTNWFGDVGSDNHYKGKFSEDRNTLIGQWEWPGGGYEATMTRLSRESRIHPNG